MAEYERHRRSGGRRPPRREEETGRAGVLGAQLLICVLALVVAAAMRFSGSPAYAAARKAVKTAVQSTVTVSGLKQAFGNFTAGLSGKVSSGRTSSGKGSRPASSKKASGSGAASGASAGSSSGKQAGSKTVSGSKAAVSSKTSASHQTSGAAAQGKTSKTGTNKGAAALLLLPMCGLTSAGKRKKPFLLRAPNGR